NDLGASSKGESVARAALDGTGIPDQTYFLTTSVHPTGLAVGPTRVYFATKRGIRRIPLEGAVGGEFGNEEFLTTSAEVGGGVALDEGFVYWSAKEGHAIGRNSVANFKVFGIGKPNGCSGSAECDESFLTLAGSPVGVAVAGGALFLSAGRENPPPPGNDLYRYDSSDPAHPLTDITATSAVPDGAGVQGVVGASSNGAYVYFVANADLDGAGEGAVGDCRQVPGQARDSFSGSCSLYLWHDGETSFVARLHPSVVGGFAEYRVRRP